jgi:hypothetical protein
VNGFRHTNKSQANGCGYSNCTSRFLVLFQRVLKQRLPTWAERVRGAERLQNADSYRRLTGGAGTQRWLGPTGPTPQPAAIPSCRTPLPRPYSPRHGPRLPNARMRSASPAGGRGTRATPQPIAATGCTGPAPLQAAPRHAPGPPVCDKRSRGTTQEGRAGPYRSSRAVIRSPARPGRRSARTRPSRTRSSNACGAASRRREGCRGGPGVRFPRAIRPSEFLSVGADRCWRGSAAWSSPVSWTLTGGDCQPREFGASGPGRPSTSFASRSGSSAGPSSPRATAAWARAVATRT